VSPKVLDTLILVGHQAILSLTGRLGAALDEAETAYRLAPLALPTTGGAARKVDQYAARKLIHSEGGSRLDPLYLGGEPSHRLVGPPELCPVVATGAFYRMNATGGRFFGPEAREVAIQWKYPHLGPSYSLVMMVCDGA
jgi:hypothetical protein